MPLCLDESSMSVIVEPRRQRCADGRHTPDIAVLQQLHQLCERRVPHAYSHAPAQTEAGMETETETDICMATPLTPLILFPGEGSLSLDSLAAEWRTGTRAWPFDAESRDPVGATSAMAAGSGLQKQDLGVVSPLVSPLEPKHTPAHILIVIDGTWSEAKILERRYFDGGWLREVQAPTSTPASSMPSAGLWPRRRVQRVVLDAGRASSYTFRKQPRVHGYSTATRDSDSGSDGREDSIVESTHVAEYSGLLSTLEASAHSLALLDPPFQPL
eukprot:g652.t1